MLTANVARVRVHPSGLICGVVLRFDVSMQQAKQATVEFALRWQDAVASHCERLYFERVNFWRSFFPGTLGEQLAVFPDGGVASQLLAPGELLPVCSPDDQYAGQYAFADPLYAVWGRAG